MERSPRAYSSSSATPAPRARSSTWYAGFQLENGALPCCVDTRGADPTPEHDSTGAFLYALGEYARHTRDAGFVRSLWPRVLRAVRRLEVLRGQRLGARWRTELGGAAFGILPESISHEGYRRRPCIRTGTICSLVRACVTPCSSPSSSATSSALARGQLVERHVRKRSCRRTPARRGSRHRVPAGSVELGDRDPSATAVGFELGGGPRDFPESALRATFAPSSRRWRSASAV